MSGTERYWAFISYSHKDAAFGRRLHRSLERYRLPGSLIGRRGPRGLLPRRLTPIFLDREEFAAAADLSAEVRSALKLSEALIVVCSPAAATSNWVAREIEVFRTLKPDGPILAAIRHGEPAESFPPALKNTGRSEDTEPLAADFRPGRDGTNLANLKLVAGIAGVGVNELVRRDQQRHLRRVTAITAATLAVALFTSLMAALAVRERDEANRQRRAAEGLVEFMLTDLRGTLKGVGRLDAMSAVNRRAILYYNDQDITKLQPDSLERRARVLHAIGEDDETRGDAKRAIAAFGEALRTTKLLLQAAPNSPERIYDHAQSEFWMGYAQYVQGRFAEARPLFQTYRKLSYRLISLDSGNPRYLREAAYAEGNLCSLALEPPHDPDAALGACKAALQLMERASRKLAPGATVLDDLANRHAWLADAYRAKGDNAAALQQRLVQESLLKRLMAADPGNMHSKKSWVALQRTLSWIEAQSGRPEDALKRLSAAVVISDDLVRFDPANKDWRTQREALDTDVAQISELSLKRRGP